MKTDAELLQHYAANGCEDAFGELIARHVNVIYSAALRFTRSDTHRAEDVTQQVFTELARNAKSLCKHPAVIGWLYTTTRHVALRVLRTEQRRLAREKEAHIMNEILRDTPPDPDWQKLAPALDAAMHALAERDRLALLLRFFQSKTFNEIGETLGLRENAARMRVDRALDKLRLELVRKGVRSTAVALATALSQNAVNATPAAFVSTLKTAALANVATTTATTFNLLNFMAVTKSQITAATAIILASIVTPVLLQQRAHAKLQAQKQTLAQQLQQQTALAAENQRLAALIANTNQSSAAPATELLRLRAEVARLRKETQELSKPKPPSRPDQLATIAERYAERVNKLKQYLAANPSETIPELQFIRDAEWLWLAGEKLPDTPEGYRRAMSLARLTVEGTVSREILRPALKQFASDHNGEFPSDLSELKAYFKTNLDDSILQRWQIIHVSKLPQMRAQLENETWMITQKWPVNRAIDQRILFGLESFHMFSDAPSSQWETLR